MPRSECPICFTDYNTGEHKIMNGSCGHSLCVECCSKLCEGTCPFCKRTRSFSKAAPNYLAMEMLTARSSLSITPSAAPLSEEHIDETTPLAVDSRIDASVDETLRQVDEQLGEEEGLNSLGIAEESQEIETTQTLPLAMLVIVSELNKIICYSVNNITDCLEAYSETILNKGCVEFRSEFRKFEIYLQKFYKALILIVLSAISSTLVTVSISDLIVGFAFGSADYRNGNNVIYLVACIVDILLYLFLLVTVLTRKDVVQKTAFLFIVVNNIFTFFLIILGIFNGLSWPITIDFISRLILLPFVFFIGIGFMVYFYRSEIKRGEKLQPKIWFIVSSAIFFVVSISDLIVGVTFDSVDYKNGNNVTNLVACIVDILLYLFVLVATLSRKGVLQIVAFLFIVANNIFTFFLIIFWIFNGFSWLITIDFLSRLVLFIFVVVIGIGYMIWIFVSKEIRKKEIILILCSTIFFVVSISDLIVGSTFGSADYKNGNNAMLLSACVADILVYLFLFISCLSHADLLIGLGCCLVLANMCFTVFLVIFWMVTGFSWPFTIELFSRVIACVVTSGIFCRLFYGFYKGDFNFITQS